ncbi:MAG: thiamine pyrophosphate-dependent enzyme, partial [Pseudomonadota bacterium]
LLPGICSYLCSSSDELIAFAEKLNIPVAKTFMAKGVIPDSHPLSLGAVGLQAKDFVSCGFDRADVIICVGFDMVEYHPHLWHSDKNKQIIHIDSLPAEVDEHYILAAGLVGDVGAALTALTEIMEPVKRVHGENLRGAIRDMLEEYSEDQGFPIKPQKIIWDLRQALNPEDIVISDVGAHKMWMARMYQTERPGTCIISNGFASMGIGVPGAIAAKLAFPDRTALTVTGDAGFLMNSQEIETALRIGSPVVILVWNDSKYGLIEWHQMRHFGRSSNIDFKNPDLVAYAESFGAKGYRVESTDQLLPTLRQAIADDTVVVIDCPVDYSENMKLTAQLGGLVCPI